MTAGEDQEPDPRRWLALITCCSALFMTLLDVSVTNVALPSIGHATSATTSQLQWVVSAYTLAFGLVPVLAGRLGDDHGRRLMFQVGVATFAATSMLAGLAPTAAVLIGARVLQGLAGGLINPQVSGLVQQLFGSAERGRAFGVLGTTVGLGTALGPIVGGVLIAAGGPRLGWRLVFFVNVPIALAVITLARRLLPADRHESQHRLDVAGAAILGAATLCILVAAVQYDSTRDARLALLVVPSALLFVAFFRRERRLTAARHDPLVDLRLFRIPSYSAGVLFALAYFPAMAGLPLVLAIYYQDGLGYSALQSGLGVTAYAVGSAVGAPLAGRVVTRIGRPLLLVGLAAFALGAGGLALLAGHGAAALAPALFVMGAGSGAIITPNQALTLMRVDPVAGSTAGGVLQTAQRIGLAVGQAIVGATFFTALGGGRHALPSAHALPFAHALRFGVLATLCFLTLAAAVSIADLIRARLRSGEPEPLAESS